MTSCRACGSARVELVLALGEHPPANRFLDERELREPEPTWPLDAYVCLDCALLQIENRLPRDFFDHYLYVPSHAEAMHRHTATLAERLAALVGDGLVVDVGCNDGLLLDACRRRGVRATGIDPARNLVATAQERGLDARVGHFSVEGARQLRDEHGPAAAIVTSNTLNHIDDLHGFLRGVVTLLAPDGRFIVEVPHAGDLVAQNQFDTLYQEHLSEFSVHALHALYAPFELIIEDITPLTLHGGSMRVVARRGAGRTAALDSWLHRERAAGLLERATYDAFRGRVDRLRAAIRHTLDERRARGRRIAGYGAPAKSTTLLLACDIGREQLDFIADKNPLKQGRYAPGTHIPIVPVEHIDTARPDDLLVLAWNLSDEIVAQQAAHAARGGAFIVPIPDVQVVTS